jgi:hypothetical protein
VKWLLGLVWFAVAATTLLAGWLIFSLTGFQFTPKVDPGAVLGAIATLFSTVTSLAIVYHINYLYATQLSSKRAETDVLLEGIRDIKASLSDVRNAAQVCQNNRKLTKAEQGALVGAERELSNSVRSLDKAFSICSTPGFTLEKLKEARTELKDALTDSPFPGPFDPVSRGRIANTFRAFRDELTEVTIRVVRR